MPRRRGVNRIAVANFLMTMRTDAERTIEDLIRDVQLCHWNDVTIQAIEDGIRLAGLRTVSLAVSRDTSKSDFRRQLIELEHAGAVCLFVDHLFISR